MKKGQLPIFAELTLDDTEDSTAKAARKFTGTDNPRHLRVIHALMIRPKTREEIDRIAGAANGPDLMAELRRRGLHAACTKTPTIDRDGFLVKPGIYALDEGDRRAINAWVRKRDAAAKGKP